MSHEVSGKLYKILAPQSGVGKNGNWVKREFVIETQEQFPKKICFSAWNDKADLLNQMSEGEMVKVSFNLESREYNSKWYTDARAWKLEKESGAQPDFGTPPPPEEPPIYGSAGDDGDLPF